MNYDAIQHEKKDNIGKINLNIQSFNNRAQLCLELVIKRIKYFFLNNTLNIKQKSKS